MVFVRPSRMNRGGRVPHKGTRHARVLGLHIRS